MSWGWEGCDTAVRIFFSFLFLRNLVLLLTCGRNHGLLTVGESVDEAAFWFMSLDRTCQAQLLVDASAGKNGNEKKIINEEEAKYSFNQVGTPEKGWLAFQGYYDALLERTKGDFLH